MYQTWPKSPVATPLSLTGWWWSLVAILAGGYKEISLTQIKEKVSREDSFFLLSSLLPWLFFCEDTCLGLQQLCCDHEERPREWQIITWNPGMAKSWNWPKVCSLTFRLLWLCKRIQQLCYLRDHTWVFWWKWKSVMFNSFWPPWTL